MHPLVIYAIVQFDQQERDRANEMRRRAHELIAAQARQAAPAPSRQAASSATPAVIGCRP